ncbi:MAG: hypothetical protein RLZZ450_5857 [Pseudomonadota bacterium]|jgi:hypothetical protein
MVCRLVPVEAGPRDTPALEAGLPTQEASVDSQVAYDSASPALDSAAEAATPPPDAGQFALLQLTPSGELQDLTTPLVATFNAVVDSSTVDPDSFRVLRDDVVIEGARSVQENTIRFEVQRAWSLGVTYKIELTAKLADERGRALVARSLDLKVRAGAWSTEDTGLLDPLYRNVRVATNASGQAALVVERLGPSPGTPEQQQISHEDAGKWSTPPRGCENYYYNLGAQRIAVAEDGRAVLACADGVDDTAALVANVSGAQLAIKKGERVPYYYPMLALTKQGVAFQPVTNTNNGGAQLSLLRFGLDDPQASKLVLTDNGAVADVAPLDNGAIVLWQARQSAADGGVSQQLWAAVLSGDGSCARHDGICGTLLGASTEDMHARVATDGTGRAVVVWVAQGFWFANFMGPDNWSEPRQIPLGGTGGTGAASRPELGMDGRGNALLAYLSHEGTVPFATVASMRLGAGAAQWTPLTNVGLNSDDLDPQLAVGEGGEAVLAWVVVDPQGGAKSLGAKYYLPGQTWLAASAIEHDSNLSLPSVAIDASGRALVAWQSARQIYIARYR